MMTRTVWQVVLLVSLAHALVHMYELALPSVEQEIATEFSPHDQRAGKELSGTLSNYWRLLWGLGALVAGFFVDRVGSRRMLAVYLLGCGGACLLTSRASSAGGLVTSMLMMGALASIYHPAGLALIANETSPENRPRALGMHGIFGSIGIGAAPLLAWLVVTAGGQWRDYFVSLAIPGIALGLVFAWSGWRHDRRGGVRRPKRYVDPRDQHAHWAAYATLLMLALLQGFVYSAQMSFLPRYLSQPAGPVWALDAGGDEANADSATDGGSPTDAERRGKLLAATALAMGCIGQYLGGKFARLDRLEQQLTMVTLANVPFLMWMAVADGWTRPVAASCFVMVHFMHQPIYNSLVPKYAPRKHLSLCYGLSFAVGLGMGGFGARFAGAFLNDTVVYGVLAGCALLASVVGLTLCGLTASRNGFSRSSGPGTL